MAPIVPPSQSMVMSLSASSNIALETNRAGSSIFFKAVILTGFVVLSASTRPFTPRYRVDIGTPKQNRFDIK